MDNSIGEIPESVDGVLIIADPVKVFALRKMIRRRSSEWRDRVAYSGHLDAVAAACYER